MAKTSGFGNVSRLQSGRFRARYIHPAKPFTPEGTRNYINAPTTFTTKTQARAWLATIQADLERGVWKSPEDIDRERVAAEIQAKRDTYTFGAFATTWLATRRLTPATRKSYDSYLTTHLLPRWEDVPLKAITTADIRAWLATLSPNAPGARKKAAELFRTILNSAVEDDYIDTSPYKRKMLTTVTAPTPTKDVKQRETTALTLTQLHALANEVPAYMRVIVLLSGLTGLRSGEARELRGRDVETITDRESGTVTVYLHISRAVTGTGKHQTIGAPKTAASVRTTKVPDLLATEIIALADRAGRDGLLFHTVADTGTHIPEVTYRTNIVRAAERLGLGHVAPHDLRRTMVTTALEAGVPMADVQAVVGHTTPSMTARYARSSAERQARAIDALNTAYVQREGGAEVASLDEKRARA